jgi:3-hydroxy acid dehydrogenase/malonic semialdehyde reductase
MWGVCVRGMVLVMQAIVPSMITAKSGHIVNFSSIHGIQTSANSSAYCAAKYAVSGLTEALAIELWKYGIKVSAICPGGVLTPFMGVSPEKKPQEFMFPEEIAEVMLNIITAPGKALMKQVVVVPKERPFTVTEVNWTR